MIDQKTRKQFIERKATLEKSLAFLMPRIVRMSLPLADLIKQNAIASAQDSKLALVAASATLFQIELAAIDQCLAAESPARSQSPQPVCPLHA